MSRFGLLLVLSCQSTATLQDDIIGGFDVNAPGLYAVGALGNAPGMPICTGTLVDATHVLTARHCVPGSLVFMLGPNAATPDRSVKVIAGEADDGDIAILTLAAAITDVPPIPMATRLLDNVGEKLLAIGYSTANNNEATPAKTRKGGAMTLFALPGEAPLKKHFATRDAYDAATCHGDIECLERYEFTLDSRQLVVRREVNDAITCRGDSGGPLLRFEDGRYVVYGVVSQGLTRDCTIGTVYRQVIPSVGEIGRVEDGVFQSFCKGTLVAPTLAMGCPFVGPASFRIRGEVIDVLAPEDAASGLYHLASTPSVPPISLAPYTGETCVREDSTPGMPLIRGGHMVGIAMTSEAAATLDERLMSAIKLAADWVDPCDGESRLGHCAGETAIRCSGAYAADRAMSQLDCAAIGLTCQQDGLVPASCGPSSEPPPPTVAAQKATFMPNGCL